MNYYYYYLFLILFYNINKHSFNSKKNKEIKKLLIFM